MFLAFTLKNESRKYHQWYDLVVSQIILFVDSISVSLKFTQLLNNYLHKILLYQTLTKISLSFTIIPKEEYKILKIFTLLNKTIKEGAVSQRAHQVPLFRSQTLPTSPQGQTSSNRARMCAAGSSPFPDPILTLVYSPEPYAESFLQALKMSLYLFQGSPNISTEPSHQDLPLHGMPFRLQMSTEKTHAGATLLNSSVSQIPLMGRLDRAGGTRASPEKT